MNICNHDIHKQYIKNIITLFVFNIRKPYGSVVLDDLDAVV
jgi:hypothetical protein